MEGVESRLGSLLARLQRQLRERDERIALLEQQLARREEDTQEEAADLLRELMGDAEQPAQNIDAEADPVPVAVATGPQMHRPQLASRLSASGTDFSLFSKKSAVRQRLSGAVGGGAGLPAASSDSPLSEEPAPSPPVPSPVPSPVPRPAANNSPGLGNKKMHLNDLNSLAVKTRRQLKQPAMTLSESAEDSPRAVVSASSPVADATESASPPPPPPAPLVQTRTASRMPQEPPSSLTRAAVLPSETVRAALQERPGAGAQQIATPSDARSRRSTSGSIFKLFVSSFPKKGLSVASPGVSLEASGPIVMAADGGFQTHQMCFSGRPLFAASPLHMIEAFPGDGSWTFAATALSAPASYRLTLDDRRFEQVRPKVWAWEHEPLLVAALLLGGEECALVTASGCGFARLAVQVPNVAVMSGHELACHLQRMASPELSLQRPPTRIKGAVLDELWPRLQELERAAVPRVLEVDFCDMAVAAAIGGPAEGKKNRRLSLNGSRGGKGCATLSALAQQHETGTEAVGYKWEGVEIRLHCQRSLAQCAREVVVCAMEDPAGLVQPAATAASVRVLLAIREAGVPQRFEVACCTRRDVSAFGPPLFQQPLKERALQSVVSAKILHAFDSIASEDSVVFRRDAIRALIQSALAGKRPEAHSPPKPK